MNHNSPLSAYTLTDSTGTAVQTTDYYPYGRPMATSTGAEVNPYKYGGKEFETGLGLNVHDFEARMLFNDHTLFNRPDPQAQKYPHLNPYLYCAANPLKYIDKIGTKILLAQNATEKFKQQFNQAYNMMVDKGIDFVVTELMNREETITLQQAPDPINGKSATRFRVDNLTIDWDPTECLLTDDCIVISSLELLSHESDHALQFLKNPKQQNEDKSTKSNNYSNKEEERVITGSETEISRKLGNIPSDGVSRKNHFGKSVYTDILLPTLDDIINIITFTVTFNDENDK